LNPAVLDAWSRILSARNDAVLWLLAKSATDPAIDNLRREIADRGVDSSRLVFAAHRPRADYLALYTHADLFVDTWPYNAHTTASDALWMGCPVVTWLGETFAGRVGASLLTAVGLPELVASDVDRYVESVLALAGDATKRAACVTIFSDPVDRARCSTQRARRARSNRPTDRWPQTFARRAAGDRRAGLSGAPLIDSLAAQERDGLIYPRHRNYFSSINGLLRLVQVWDQELAKPELGRFADSLLTSLDRTDFSGQPTSPNTSVFAGSGRPSTTSGPRAGSPSLRPARRCARRPPR
jgi:hypothetical protein